MEHAVVVDAQQRERGEDLDQILAQVHRVAQEALEALLRCDFRITRERLELLQRIE